MRKNILFLALASLVLTGCTGLKYGVKTSALESSENFRLLDDVVPNSYDLSLWVNSAKDHFTGQVIIDLELKSDRDSFLLNSKDITILSSILKGENLEIKAKYFALDKDGLMRVDLGKVVPKGTYKLEINYQGKYQEDLSGLYRVKDGDDFYLYTQFEPVAARKMLPCFDEPKFKTPFRVKVIAPKGQTAIANGALEQKFEQGDDEVHVFKSTKPMSTYLLAVAVGPFDVVAGPTIQANKFRKESFEFRGIATKGKGAKLAFALKETPEIISELENYFGVGYPYEKLDILAVPDFGAGAMENVGAITFREWYLLLDEKTASVDQRRGFYLVMAHELAHQWFGNLVTMPWWDDLWLNEAFATWLSYKIVDQIKPEYKSAAHLLGRSHSAMEQDTLMSVRKIREPIATKHDIHNAFDSITYEKGGALLNMLESYLGPAKFKDAVSSHISRFQFGLATSKDFLESLAQFSESSLVESADTFLNQTGVPLVTLSYQCTNNDLNVQLNQKRYVPIGSKASSATLWKIPVCFGYEKKGSVKKHCVMLDQESATVKIPKTSCPAFVMPNYQGQGYYRYSLNPQAWKNLLKKPALLSERDRISIAESLMGELYAGGLEFSFVAESLRDLVDRKSSMVTNYFLKVIEEAHYFWLNDDNRVHALSYASQLKQLYRDLSTDKLSQDQRVLRQNLAGFLAHVVKDQDTRLDLSIVGNDYLKQVGLTGGEATVSADENLLDTAVEVAMQFKSDETLKEVETALVSGLSDTVARSHLLSGLARSREGDAANGVRNLVFGNLRKNEKLGLLYKHLANPKNQPATWNFLKANFAKVKATFTNPQMANLPYLAEGLCTVEDAAEVNDFFAPTIAQYQGGPRTLAEVVEQIEICAARKSHTSVLANTFFSDAHTPKTLVKE